MTGVYTVLGVGGCVIFIVRGIQDADSFFFWLATANAVFWLGLLALVLVVDNRRRRTISSDAPRP